jgi:peptidoglycan/LPS O-acetylase OafA/YrhL
MNKNGRRVASLPYRADIDGLRALAVVPVILYHSFPSLVPGGVVGVDVFFVISGFLITSIIIKQLRAGTFSFPEFWSKRVLRIYPSLLLVTTATLLLGWFYFLPAEFEALKSHSRWGLAFSANFKLNSEIGYFDLAADFKPLLHLWSLSIEEQFYFVWPLILWVCFRLHWSQLGFSIIFFLASAYCNKFFQYSTGEAFYLPWTRFWELMAGGIVAIYRENHYLKDNKINLTWIKRLLNKAHHVGKFLWISHVLSFTGISAIVFAMFYLNKVMHWPSKKTLIPVLGAVLVIIAGQQAWLNKRILSHTVPVFIGRISYPLYLWHWPLLAVLRIINPEASAQLILGTVAISFFLSMLTYYYVEKIFRSGEPPKIKWKTPVLVSLQLAVLSLTYLSFQTRSGDYDISKINNAIGNGIFPTKEMVFSRTPKGIGYQKLVTESDRFVLFIGDSHMDHYGSRIQEIAKLRPREVYSSMWITQGECLMVKGFAKSNDPSCEGYHDVVLDIIKNHKDYNIDRVVWAASWFWYLKEDGFGLQKDPQGQVLKDPTKHQFRLQAVKDFIRTLHDSGLETYVVLDYIGGPDFNPRTMIRRSLLGKFEFGADDISLAEAVGRQGLGGSWLQKITEDIGAKVINPLDYLCQNQKCPIKDASGRPLLRDTNHFTQYTAIESLNYIDVTVLINSEHTAESSQYTGSHPRL